ncbi:MAG: hypothetical protein WBF71_03130 [Microthrixaceae bacterium]
MRYEVVQIAQFLFAVALIGGAFAAGILVGWAKWGSKGSAGSAGTGRGATRPTGHESRPATDLQPARLAPENLFAPVSSPTSTSSTARSSVTPSPTVFVLDSREVIDLRGPANTGRSTLDPIELGPALDDPG